MMQTAERMTLPDTVASTPLPFQPKGGKHVVLMPTAIARVLAALAVFLVLASIGGQVSRFVFGHDTLKGFVHLFDLDAEQNIPTYFTVLLMIAVALLLSLIALLHRTARTRHAWPWVLLSIGFVYMGYDEVFAVHENLYVPVRAVLGDHIPRFIQFAWVIPGAALVIVLAIVFRSFLFQLPRASRRAFALAATIYLGGALGGDLFLTGPYAALYGERNLAYSLLSTLEETLEMAGLIVFIWALVKYCAHVHRDVRFQFNS
jgi:hypothetical protein